MNNSECNTIADSVAALPASSFAAGATQSRQSAKSPIPVIVFIADMRRATEPRARFFQADLAARGARIGFSAGEDAAAALACRPFDPRPILCAISRRAAE